jgi:hypothetical protein
MKKLLLAVPTALLLAASLGGGAALAQPFPLPIASAADYAHDPVAQVMLAGEASAVSTYLGISTDQLRTELTGHSLADVARQHGKSASDITSVVVQAANQQLDTAVSAGDLSSDTAAGYRAQIGLFAPFLVNSADASAMALQVAADAA